LGSQFKVNRWKWKSCCRILAAFCQNICNLAVNLAGFRNCLADYTVPSLLPCYGLLTALVLLNSVVRWCN